MEIKKEYSVLFNAISEVIALLEESIEKDKKILKVLRASQIMAEELIISEDKNN